MSGPELNQKSDPKVEQPEVIPDSRLGQKAEVYGMLHGPEVEVGILGPSARYKLEGFHPLPRALRMTMMKR
jgi:hypothetical protein